MDVELKDAWQLHRASIFPLSYSLADKVVDEASGREDGKKCLENTAHDFEGIVWEKLEERFQNYGSFGTRKVCITNLLHNQNCLALSFLLTRNLRKNACRKWTNSCWWQKKAENECSFFNEHDFNSQHIL